MNITSNSKQLMPKAIDIAKQVGSSKALKRTQIVANAAWTTYVSTLHQIPPLEYMHVKQLATQAAISAAKNTMIMAKTAKSKLN